MNTALAAATSDRESGKKHILDETFLALQTFAPEFEEKVTTISQKLSARSKEIEERNSSLDKLSTFVRD